VSVVVWFGFLDYVGWGIVVLLLFVVFVVGWVDVVVGGGGFV